MRTHLETQPVLFIQGAGGMHQPEGSGRLAAYLARELGICYATSALATVNTKVREIMIRPAMPRNEAADR